MKFHITITNKPNKHTANHSADDWERTQQNERTYTGFVRFHIESINQVLQEGAHQTEVESADTPRAVYQDDDISHCRRGAHKLIHYG